MKKITIYIFSKYNFIFSSLKFRNTVQKNLNLSPLLPSNGRISPGIDFTRGNTNCSADKPEHKTFDWNEDLSQVRMKQKRVNRHCSSPLSFDPLFSDGSLIEYRSTKGEKKREHVISVFRIEFHRRHIFWGQNDLNFLNNSSRKRVE